MRYNVEDIEDQILATLQEDGNLAGVFIESHPGDINSATFANPEMVDLFTHRLPLIVVQYQGRTVSQVDSTQRYHIHELTFRLYVGSRGLKTSAEIARGCYSLLRSVYDDLHGKVPLGSPNYSAEIQRLSGVSITTSGFNPQSPLMAANGTDEKLVVNLPGIKIYQTDYRIRLQA